MAGLSNSNRPFDGIECRPVAHGEIEAGLRLILASESGLASDAQVLDFLSFCVERKIETRAMWVATEQGRIVWAMLPVLSPGQTMLLFTPMVRFRQTPTCAIQSLCRQIAAHYGQRGVQLAQMLIDPAHREVIKVYRQAEFEELAELIYLQKSLRKRPMEIPALPPGASLETYSRNSHAAFAELIHRSYEQSLDCPMLNGMRKMDDVIAGHQAAGEFDPNLWWLLREHGTPRAVLLLARLPQSTSIELVYLGLTVDSRGRGLGDWLMRYAIAIATQDGRDSLSLAVDSRNKPALRLYFRHGMLRIGTRVAMLRVLRQSDSRAELAPADQSILGPES